MAANSTAAASAAPIRLIIAGSRTFAAPDPEALMNKIDAVVAEQAARVGIEDLKDHLEDLSDLVELASGKAKGADEFGERWAKSRNVPVRDFPALWDKHGRAAGPIRNQEMADWAAETRRGHEKTLPEGHAGILFAIWNGKSPGTRSMIASARARGLAVVVERTDEP